MREIFFLLLILSLSACGSMPSKKYEKIKSANLVHASALELVKSHPGKVELVKAPVDFAIDASSPVVSIEKKLTVGNVFRIRAQGDETPFLVLASWYHKMGFTDVGVVFPRVFIFDQGHRAQKVQIAQVGIDMECGLYICFKSTYRIADLPPGIYSVVVTSQVDDIDKPLADRRQDTVTYAPGVGLIPVSAIYTLYADFYGDFTAKFSKELPMDPKRKDIKTFIQ